MNKTIIHLIIIRISLLQQ